MPKSRNRKNHKAKVAARNKRITEANNRVRNLLKKELEMKIAEADAVAQIQSEQTQTQEPTPEITIAEDAKD